MFSYLIPSNSRKIIKEMRKSIYYLAAAVAIVIAFTSCSKDEDGKTPDLKPDTAYDVYIAGYESNGEHLVAKYWKNGVETVLSNGKYDAQATSIYIADNSIYVAGYESNGKKNVAKYWKDGVEICLTDGSQNARANDILKINNGIHVVGMEGDYGFNTFDRQPVYWKDGTPTILSAGKSEGEAISIVNDEGNVYILIQHINTRAASYWKNDSYVDWGRVTFPLDARTSSMAVDNGNVYIVGSATYTGPTIIATLWENGHPTQLSGNQSLTNANARAIAIENKNIYVGGYENGQATYWKNGIPYTLPDGQEVSAISVDNENVFAAGSTRSSNGNVIKFWKNMKAISITSGKYVAHANDMKVIKK